MNGVRLDPSPCRWWRVAAMLALVAGGLISETACGATHPPPDVADETPSALPAPGVRDQLAGLAAAAKDRRYVATYTLKTAKRADRTVTVAYATDDTWLVSIPGGALGGYADIAILGTATGLYECALGPAAGAGTIVVEPRCSKVTLSSSTDPRVQHLFTDWIDELTDRDIAISVDTAPVLAGAKGSCFSVESNSAQLAPPVDPGVYCYDSDGTLTGARLGFGTLILTTSSGAPTTITMPAPITPGTALPQKAPPRPSPTPSASPSGSPVHADATR
jgi:hypothetical protein